MPAFKKKTKYNTAQPKQKEKDEPSRMSEGGQHPLLLTAALNYPIVQKFSRQCIRFYCYPNSCKIKCSNERELTETAREKKAEREREKENNSK